MFTGRKCFRGENFSGRICFRCEYVSGANVSAASKFPGRICFRGEYIYGLKMFAMRKCVRGENVSGSKHERANGIGVSWTKGSRGERVSQMGIALVCCVMRKTRPSSRLNERVNVTMYGAKLNLAQRFVSIVV